MTTPLALSHLAARGLARSIRQGDDAACGAQPQAACDGPASGGPALCPTHAKES